MIRILDKNTADKIAAGEVVERPLSIVKELVENSIDAGAGNIVVEIKNGGKTYIRVTDNGCGIKADECELAFMRHATSKITVAEDLNAIDTLGFRGEALASIAAVSRTELLTKTADSKTGKKVSIYGGEVAESVSCGCPDGTTIVVRDLFYNTPARLKFLKADSTESSAVIDFVTNIALAYPEIRIRMINNDKILFATNGKGNRGATIGTLTSNIVKEKLIAFEYNEDKITVEGYVSGPGESRSSRKSQVFFVNGRVVDSKVIEKGINKAYSDRLFEGRFPICYLFLHVPPERMDVNIHPNKRQVRFYDETVITEIVQRGIITALNSNKAVPEVKESITYNSKPQPQSAGHYEFIEKTEKINSQPFKVKEKVDINNILSNYEHKKENLEVEEQMAVFETNSMPVLKSDSQNTAAQRFNFLELTVHGQFFGTYIQLSDIDAIYYVDQHAAHERIFFEKLSEQWNNSKKHSQPIMFPIVKDVSHSDKEKESSWLPLLKNMGFFIEDFGPLSYKISEIPAFMDIKEAENFLDDFIDSIGEYTDFNDERTLNKIATRACKAAVKANDTLSDEEINRLLADLSKCKNPFSCPHGRPTFIKITKNDMEKRFKRT